MVFKRGQRRLQYKLRVDIGIEGNESIANISATLVIFAFIKDTIDKLSPERGEVKDRWTWYFGDLFNNYTSSA